MKKTFLSSVAAALLLTTTAHVMERSEPQDNPTHSQKQKVVNALSELDNLILNRTHGTIALFNSSEKRLRLFDQHDNMLADIHMPEIAKHKLDRVEKIFTTKEGVFISGTKINSRNLLLKLSKGQLNLIRESRGYFHFAQQTSEIYEIGCELSHFFNVLKNDKFENIPSSPFQVDYNATLLPTGDIFVTASSAHDNIALAYYNGTKWVQSPHLNITNSYVHTSPEGEIYVSGYFFNKELNKAEPHLYHYQNNNWQLISLPESISSIQKLEFIDDKIFCHFCDMDTNQDKVLYYDNEWHQIDFSESGITPNYFFLIENGDVVFQTITPTYDAENLFIRTEAGVINVDELLKDELVDNYSDLQAYRIGHLAKDLYQLITRSNTGSSVGITFRKNKVINEMRNYSRVYLSELPATLDDVIDRYGLELISENRFDNNKFERFFSRLEALKTTPSNRESIFDVLLGQFNKTLDPIIASTSSSSHEDSREVLKTNTKIEIIETIEKMIETYSSAWLTGHPDQKDKKLYQDVWFAPYLHALYVELSGADRVFFDPSPEDQMTDIEMRTFTKHIYASLSEIFLLDPEFAEKRGYSKLLEKVTQKAEELNLFQ